MSDERIELSIIIVNWNGGEMVQQCVSSLLAATAGMKAELWLVDNASTDGSAEAAARAYPGLRLIQNQENVGFARAANQAIERARGDFLLLLNPDAQLDAEALKRMLKVMGNDPRIGIAGCPSVDGQGRRAPGYEMSYPGQRGSEVRQAEGDGRDVAWVSGACLVARRALIEEIGPLDPGFFMYYEDVDWCYRARAARWRVVTIPEVAARHALGGSSRLVPPAERARWAACSRLRFYRKHYSRGQARWLALRLFASALLGVLWRLAPSLLSASVRTEMGKELARLRAALTHTGLGEKI